MASQDTFSSFTRHPPSKKSGFIGALTILLFQVKIATISDMGGLTFAWGWRHNKATLIVCITSFSTKPPFLILGSMRSTIFDLAYNFHAYYTIQEKSWQIFRKKSYKTCPVQSSKIKSCHVSCIMRLSNHVMTWHHVSRLVQSWHVMCHDKSNHIMQCHIMTI